MRVYNSIRRPRFKSWWQITLEVKIETPENITKVTQDMYRNAAVTLELSMPKSQLQLLYQLQVRAP